MLPIFYIQFDKSLTKPRITNSNKLQSIILRNTIKCIRKQLRNKLFVTRSRLGYTYSCLDVGWVWAVDTASMQGRPAPHWSPAILEWTCTNHFYDHVKGFAF